MQTQKVRTLVVDDSPFIRTMLRSGLSQDPRIEVVGLAEDGIEAIKQIKRLRPDVVTLDVEMPRLNGIGVLERVAGKVPISFVMVSTLTKAGGSITFDALQRGAFDYVTKPGAGQHSELAKFKQKLAQMVVAASKAKGCMKQILKATGGAAPTMPPCHARGWVVAIGISCGGPQTLTKMMPAFPSDYVPIIITIHMPYPFTTSFAANLNNACAANVREAAEGDKLEQGTILIAPGSRHLRIARQGVDLRVRLDDGPKVSLHKPSVDVMLSSVARACGPRSIGVIMTGMGNDGAKGIVEMHQADAWTIAQDEETSLVFGMPKVAAATGEIDHVLPLSRIPPATARLMEKGVRRPAEAR